MTSVKPVPVGPVGSAVSAASASASASTSTSTPSPTPSPPQSLISTIWTNPSFMNEHGLAKLFLAGQLLATVFFWGLYLTLCSTLRMSYGLYLICMAIFHSLEFLVTALAHPHSVSFSSTILNHSRAYNRALAVATVEYWIESLLFPKSPLSITSDTSSLVSFYVNVSFWSGLIITIGGQILRTTAMYQAGRNFTHQIRGWKQADHVLVTTGVYAWSRHPGYCGWFWWSVGTQLLCCSPLCTVAYFIASWKFFADRIPDEEAGLVKFFGAAYHEYAATHGTGIPFLNPTPPPIVPAQPISTPTPTPTSAVQPKQA